MVKSSYLNKTFLFLLIVLMKWGYSQDSTGSVAKNTLTGPVTYKAEQISMDPENQRMELRGKSRIHYQKFTLVAGIIRIDWKNNLVYADPDTMLDSTGTKILTDYPVFIEAGRDTLYSESIIYNIQSKEGKLFEGRTRENNNYYRGKDIRKVSDKTMMIRHGYFTTCNKDTPDYYFACKQMEMTIDDKIVARDITFNIEDIPLAYIPFGVFPNKRGRQSGFLIPRYEYSDSRGRTLRDIGYYWVVNDYMDAEFSSDFFEKRGLLYRGKIRYAKRYWFSGYFNGEFTPVDLSTGDKRERWKLDYSHSQIISPDTRLSARGTFISDKKYNSDLYARIENRLDQQLFNSVSYSTRWPTSKNSLNINLQSQQNLNTGTYSYTLPDVRFSHAQRHLFGEATGKKSFWHDIYYSYNFSTRNQFNHTVTINSDSTETIAESKKRGAQHLVSLSAPTKIFKYFNLSPALSYTEIWQDQLYAKKATVEGVETNEVNGFAARRTFNVSLGARTTLYGIFPVSIGTMRSIRHKVDPSVSLTYQPDFSDLSWGYYTTYTDTSGNKVKYDRFANSIYGSTPSGRRGTLSFSLANLFQAKFIENGNETKKDLFRLKFSGSYNFAAESYKLSDIRASMTATPTKNFNLQSGFTLSPYQYDDDGNGKKDEYLGFENGLLRLLNFNLSTGFSISGKELGKSLTGKADSLEQAEEDFVDTGDVRAREEKDHVIRELKANSFSWQLKADISYRYNANDRNNIAQSLDLVPSATVNLTENWRIRWYASMDIMKKKINYQRYSIYRDLHCWELSFEWAPNVDYPQASYFFLRIGIKDPILRDLKLEQTSNRSPYF